MRQNAEQRVGRQGRLALQQDDRGGEADAGEQDPDGQVDREKEAERDAALVRDAAALEAGAVLLLDKEAVLAEAKRLGIGLLGFE